MDVLQRLLLLVVSGSLHGRLVIVDGPYNPADAFALTSKSRLLLKARLAAATTTTAGSPSYARFN